MLCPASTPFSQLGLEPPFICLSEGREERQAVRGEDGNFGSVGDRRVVTRTSVIRDQRPSSTAKAVVMRGTTH